MLIVILWHKRIKTIITTTTATKKIVINIHNRIKVQVHYILNDFIQY